MKTLVLLLCLSFLTLEACSSGNSALPQQRVRTSHGDVTVTFKVPVQQPATASTLRRPQYFSPATTTLAIALKSVNGASVSGGTQPDVFDLSKICQQSGAFFYCSTTITLLSGDDVVGVVAYSTKPIGKQSGNIPLSFGEGEVIVGSGSGAVPAGAESTTGRLSVNLSPVIYGGQVVPGPSPQPNTVPITLASFEDASTDAIPASAYQNLAPAPPFANTPYLVDSDSSNLTSLTNLTTGQTGAAVAIQSPTDQIQLNNSGKESAGQKVTAALTFGAPAANARFTIPAYFQMSGAVSAGHTVLPPNSSSVLTFTCTSSGCTKAN